MAVRPLASTASSASRASPGEVSSTRRAAPACTTMTLTLCVTTSCISLAIRARSSATARRVCASCSCSARRSRSADSPARCRQRRMAIATDTVGSRISSAVKRPGTGGVVFGYAAVTMAPPRQHGEQRQPAERAVGDRAVRGEDHGHERDRRRFLVVAMTAARITQNAVMG